jgi:hypothetical protein
MTLLYINSWSIKDPLTISSTLPNLRVLSDSSLIKEIILITPEYQEVKNIGIDIKKVKHFTIPLNFCTQPFLLKYICQDLQAKKVLKKISHQYKIDRILARGSSATGKALWVHKITKKPFYIESFEPHSEVMKESGVWKPYDPRYIVQALWEQKSIKKATGLLPVSNNYAKKLVNQYRRENKSIAMVPCTVNSDKFIFNFKKRLEIRQKLSIDNNAIVGIYVGKFGGIYYDEEAFEAFENAFKTIKNFHLILLSPIKEDELKNKISNFPKIDLTRFHHAFVPHKEISDYLSASDFAYALIKSQPSTKYCSAIKIGEYWANGLPIIISKGVGDDARIIKKTRLGAIYNPLKNNHQECIEEILNILKIKNYRKKIVDLAIKYRNPKIIQSGYKQLGFIDDK